MLELMHSTCTAGLCPLTLGNHKGILLEVQCKQLIDVGRQLWMRRKALISHDSL